MKKIYLVTLLFLSLSFLFPLYSSAVTICKVKAAVVRQIPNNTDDPYYHTIEIKALKAEYFMGHSAGDNCKDRFSNFNGVISFRLNPVRNFMPGEKIEVFHETIYNISESGKNVFKRWYIKDE